MLSFQQTGVTDCSILLGASASLSDYIRCHTALGRCGGAPPGRQPGVLLPHAGRQAAQQRRPTKALAAMNAQVGLACFPEDGEDPKGLLRASGRAPKVRNFGPAGGA
jgi:hypothetical protein